MIISKFISIFLPALIFASIVFAQENSADKGNLIQPAGQQESVGENIDKINLDALYRRINERDSIIKSKKPIEQVELLRQTVADKDTIIEVLIDTINKKNEILNNFITEIQIVRFFNIEDSSIFNSNFENLSLSEIPLCLRNHYQLIEDIRKLNELLSEIGQILAEIESAEITKNLPDSIKQEILKQPLIIEYLDKADALIGKIDEKDKSGLYPEQANYYRPLLIDKFNGYLDKIYSNE
jgi:hypothetical protein